MRNLGRHLQAKDWHRFKKEAASVSATASQAKSITTSDARESAERVISSANKVMQSGTSAVQGAIADRLILELQTLHTHLEYFTENLKWR